MSNRDKILNFLRSRKDEQYCDDCLSGMLEIYPRQQVNQICRNLLEMGYINRERGLCSNCSKYKIVNSFGRLDIIHPHESLTNRENSAQELAQGKRLHHKMFEHRVSSTLELKLWRVILVALGSCFGYLLGHRLCIDIYFNKEATMSKRKSHVRLSALERGELEQLTSGGVGSIRKYKRARVLLLADEAQGQQALCDEEIARLSDVSVGTVERLRRRFVEEGLQPSLSEKPRPGRPRTFSGHQRAQVTALACSTPPEGRTRWTLRLLADKLVELSGVEGISHTTVRRVLKKTT